ncbi:MAG: EamA/RhaT family transporter, partial [Massilia sp.]
MTAANPLRGILLFVTSLVLFACLDTTTKYLAARHDVPLIVAARYIGNLLLMVALLAPRHGAVLVQTRRTGLVMVRGLCLAASSILVGLALQRMPVAETTAINFLA